MQRHWTYSWELGQYILNVIVTLSRESEIFLQFYQIEKSSNRLQIEAMELENFISLRNGKCQKKCNIFPFLLSCVQFYSFCAVSQTLDSGHYLVSLPNIRFSFGFRRVSNFLWPHNLIWHNASMCCEYLLVSCTFVQSIMVLAYTVEPLCKIHLRDKLFMP
jgi:hypothetical protein